jgi:hypothetical protein
MRKTVEFNLTKKWQKELWQKFGVKCDKEGLKKAGVIKELIKEWVYGK